MTYALAVSPRDGAASGPKPRARKLAVSPRDGAASGPKPRARKLALIAIPALLTLGCGATTLRLELAPTVDTQGHPGFEAALGLGAGLPLDYHGRSHHYFQARPSLGGGLDGAARKPHFLAAADFDYIYWAEPRMDVRAGLRLSHRRTEGAKLYGFGARLGLLPIVKSDEGGWLVTHLAIGPELRYEQLFGDPAESSRGLLSAPLVIEGNFLGAGD